MLIGLVHEGSERCISTRLKGAVIGNIDIRDVEVGHQGFGNGGGEVTGHAGKGKDINNTVEPTVGHLKSRCYAEACLRANLK